jgi:3-hydroxybutyryl-CoA dehydratase
VSESAASAFPPVVHRLSQPVVDRYAELTGDHNPLHVDPSFAATTPFGRTIAHGGIPLQTVYAALLAWLERDSLAGVRVVSAFLAPTMADATVTCRLIGVEAGPELVEMHIECWDDEGAVTVAATASVPVAICLPALL